MNSLVGEEEDLVFDSERDREPVKRFDDGGNMIVFTRPHQDPGNVDEGLKHL